VTPVGREWPGLPCAQRDPLMSVKVRVPGATRIFRNAGTDGTRRRGTGTIIRQLSAGARFASSGTDEIALRGTGFINS
jgi:hypothetical protein